MWARHLSFLGYRFSSLRQDLTSQDQPDVEELWCRFRSDLRVKDIVQSEQWNTRWDDGDVSVWLDIEAESDVLWLLDREAGGDVIFPVESEVEAEQHGDWIDLDGSEVQSNESTETKNMNENSSNIIREGR